MDRAQKEALVDELGQIFTDSGVVVVSHYAGITVAEMQDFRARMRDAGGFVRVAKNKLAKIALEGKPCESITGLLDGMTVHFLFRRSCSRCESNGRHMPKITTSLLFLVDQWVKMNWTALVLKPLPLCRHVKSLSASIVGCIAAPASNIAGAIGAPASNIASILETIEEKAA